MHKKSCTVCVIDNRVNFISAGIFLQMEECDSGTESDEENLEALQQGECRCLYTHAQLPALR